MGFNFEAMYRISPDACGELLREMFFIEQSKTGRYQVGCYTTFTPPSDAVKLTDEKRRLFWESVFTLEDLDMAVRSIESMKSLYPEEKWDPVTPDALAVEREENIQNSLDLGDGYSFYVGETQVFCLWYWDGDGVLLFVLPNRAVINTDCKKDHGWEDL